MLTTSKKFPGNFLGGGGGGCWHLELTDALVTQPRCWKTRKDMASSNALESYYVHFQHPDLVTTACTRNHFLCLDTMYP